MSWDRIRGHDEARHTFQTAFARGRLGQAYLFTKDVPGISNCYDQCAVNWPPLLTQGNPALTEGVPGILGSTVRKDSTVQATYNGWPLYRYVEDTDLGDAQGNKVADEWGRWTAISPDEMPPA